MGVKLVRDLEYWVYGTSVRGIAGKGFGMQDVGDKSKGYSW